MAITISGDTPNFSAATITALTSTTGTVTTLTTTTISDGTNSTSSTNCIQGSAKAWVNYNASSGTASIRASYNVTSVTVTATGYHTITLTNALTDANYSVVGSFSANYGSANAGGMSLFTTNSGPTEIAPTTTVFGVYMVTTGNVAYNPKYVCLTVNR
jgi:hypothetical protein